MHQNSIKTLTVTMLLIPIANSALRAQNKQVITSEKPNIIMILVDDMGYSDLGCYGSEIETPHLDSLANYGVRFTQFHNTAKCFPSRASLLTGLYAHQCGMSENPAAIINSISLGDMLRTAGYTTLFSGKNHSQTPLYGFGFDHTCEFLGGSTSHFNPGPQRAGEPYPIDKGKVGNYSTFNFDNVTNKAFVTDSTYYSTNFFTDRAIDFIDKAPADKPFFLYLSYTAPHDPLQAPEKDIAKYRGKYRVGYAAIRNARWQKMKNLGMVDSTMTLSAPTYAAWPTIDSLQAKEDARMAVYAAMVDCIDQNVGKLIARLKQMGKLENTLIMFASDNGASAEGKETNPFNVPQSGEIGSISYYAFPGQSWPNVCNTPYRYTKNDSYEGGICTPFIAFWPAGIPNKGIINNNAYHFIDVMPTLKEISGGTYPTAFRGQNIVPMQGKSFLPALLNTTDIERDKPIFWQWAKGEAVRVGDWKAVSIKGTWSLFDLSVDRNETKDLKTTNATKFNELKALYDNWIATVGDITGIESITKSVSEKLFPNPSSSAIHWSHIDGLSEVVVTNLNGSTIKKIKNPTTDYVDLNNLNKGVYTISLYQNNLIISTQKIVKE